MKTFDEVSSYVFRKAGKLFFVYFVSFCIAASFCLFIYFMDIDKAWYFFAGTVYSALHSLLRKATEDWRKR